MDINSHYLQGEVALVPELLLKYAKKDPRHPNQQDEDRVLDIKFMNDKFHNKINSENIDKLVSYEQITLDKAKEYLQFKEEDFTHGFKKVNAQVVRVSEKMDSTQNIIADMQESLLDLFDMANLELPLATLE